MTSSPTTSSIRPSSLSTAISNRTMVVGRRRRHRMHTVSRFLLPLVFCAGHIHFQMNMPMAFAFTTTTTITTPSFINHRRASASKVSMMVEYKPPVQRSVRKLQQSSRITSQPSAVSPTATNHRGRQTDRSRPKGSETVSPSSSRRKTSAAAAATVTVTSPTPSASSSASPRRSFEDRMRGLLGRQNVQQRRRQQQASSSSSSSVPTNLVVVDNLADFKDVLVQAREREQLVCVGFFANWCKACQATLPRFVRSCHEFPNVQFVKIPVSHNNIQLHQGLGVATLPSAHIYHPTAGLVEDEIKLASPSRNNNNADDDTATAADSMVPRLERSSSTTITTAPPSSSSPPLRHRGIGHMKNVLQTYVQGKCSLES